MKRTVFYSWQSNLPSNVCSDFIEAALKDAFKKIGEDEQTLLRPSLDRDTVGVAGTPDIADSIFSKVAAADIFVADLSIVRKKARDGARATPNANVLIELGYAISKLGWTRIILVLNTHFGMPEDLPFDLRGRRTICYNLAPGIPDLTQEFDGLKGKLIHALEETLWDSSRIERKYSRTTPVWWGKWNLKHAGPATRCSLFIYEAGPSGFLFKISGASGGHVGDLSGLAQIVSSDLAYWRDLREGIFPVGELSFQRKIVEGQHEIKILETSPVPYHGAAMTFGGIYSRSSDYLFGVLNELDLQRLYSITGEYFDDLLLRFQAIGPGKNLDKFSAVVIAGGVSGMFTHMAAIVMRGPDGQLWAAYIANSAARYFTTEPEYKNKLPLTIERWLGDKTKDVIYQNDVQRIPT